MLLLLYVSTLTHGPLGIVKVERDEIVCFNVVVARDETYVLMLQLCYLGSLNLLVQVYWEFFVLD